MDTVPKVHRQRHQRRSVSRRHQERNNSDNNTNNRELVSEIEATTTDSAIMQATRTNTTTAIAPHRRSHSPVAQAAATNTGEISTITAASIVAAEEGLATHSRPSAASEAALVTLRHAAARTRLMQQNEREIASSDALEEQTSLSTERSKSPRQTVVLVNGYSVSDDQEESKEMDLMQKQQPAQPDNDQVDEGEYNNDEQSKVAQQEDTEIASVSKNKESLQADDATKRAESPQPNSSRNSSGDAMSLRETLQQLPPTTTVSGLLAGAYHHHHHHHHHHQQQRRRTSPSPGRRSRLDEPDPATSYFHRGIVGFMDREGKTSGGNVSALGSPSPTPSGATKKLQSLSDPQASPAQRSTRSRSSLEKSPRRKRSKSESRRRRERKLIAAGEMEVRQANETLMRYLKQCTEMNEASLSGELEIDQNLDERRVHRKTKTQRDKRGQIISGLSSILKELSDDIIPADGDEIYNPFTPVVSPTDDVPAHIDKMFVQTSSGYRPVDLRYYKHSFLSGQRGLGGARRSTNTDGGTHTNDGAILENGSHGNLVGLRRSGNLSETRCLLEAQCRSSDISSNLHLACLVQRIWLLFANICHGLLAGLALAHLLFILTSHPTEWSKVINEINLVNDIHINQLQQTQPQEYQQHQLPSLSIESAGINYQSRGDPPSTSSTASSSVNIDDILTHTPGLSMSVIADYAAFAEVYGNTFYCLAIICLVSVFDRMDICRLDLSNASELISFRWIIIGMIYVATIILSICSNTIDETLYFNHSVNVTLTQEEMMSNQVLNVWNSLSMARSLGAIFGWILIGLSPNEDLLYEHLLDMAI